MQRQDVSSSQIESVGYDPETRTLEIEFATRAVYEYYNVPPDIFDEFMRAPSHGAFFGSAIRNNYEYKRL